ncbi:rhomboid-like protein 20 isoform X3 [Nicotiana tomentosiformis]|uniref:rhomboid-like protein 20 isoform X3 n=1 Tax=Nicotiana tomentosiformis TaxID=4098 RepID=UPI00388C447B
MNVGPSGFNNAPVTRALVIACTLFTIIFGTQGRANQLGWSYQVFLLFSFVLSLLLAVLALQLIKDSSQTELDNRGKGLIVD